MPLGREHIRHAFAAIVQRCLHHALPVISRKVLFAEPGDPLFSGRTRQEDQIFVMLLAGKHQVRHYSNSQLTHTTFNTSHVYFMDTDCPSKFEFKHPCQRFGIAVNPARISMSWNRHTPPDDAKIPDLLYQSHQVPPRVLALLFDLMASRRDAADDSVLASHVAHMILLAIAELLTKPQPTINDPVDHHRLICDYLDENMDQPLDRKTVSAFFHLHPDYISRLFAREGMGFSEYLESRRMLHAGELLKGSQLPINRIAQMCGYSSSGYFIKVFRKHHQMSPGQYRHHS
jgi:AraC-like DNA-binding protein